MASQRVPGSRAGSKSREYALGVAAALPSGTDGARPWRLRAARLAPLLGVVVAVAVVELRAMPAVDLAALLHGARSVARGRSPYSSVHSRRFLAGHAFVYPWIVARASTPLTHLSTAGATWCVRAISLLAIAASAALVDRRPATATALIVVSSSAVIGLQDGTLNALLLLGIVAAWRWRGRPLCSGVLIGILGIAKLFLAPLLVWPLLAGRRSTALIGATVGASLLVVGWVVGPMGPGEYTAMLGRLALAEAPRGWSLVALLMQLKAPLVAAQAMAALAAMALVLVAARRARRTPITGRASARLQGSQEWLLFASAVVGCLLASSIVWSSYLLVGYAVVLTAGEPGETGDISAAGRTALLAVLAVGSWALTVPDALGPRATALGAALAVGCAGLALAELRVGRRRSLPLVSAVASPAGVVGALTLTALCAALATTARGPAPLVVVCGLLSMLALRRRQLLASRHLSGDEALPR